MIRLAPPQRAAAALAAFPKATLIGLPISSASKASSREVKNELHRYKRSTAKSGRGGKAGRVKSRKQAIAIALSKARKKGKKVPRKKR